MFLTDIWNSSFLGDPFPNSPFPYAVLNPEPIVAPNIAKAIRANEITAAYFLYIENPVPKKIFNSYLAIIDK